MRASRRGATRDPREVRAGWVSVGVMVCVALLGAGASLAAGAWGATSRSSGNAFVLNLYSGYPRASVPTQEAVSVAAQLDAAGQGTLLVSTPSAFNGEAVVQAVVDGSSLSDPAVGHMPAGWTAAVRGQDLVLSGPPIEGPNLSVRIDIGVPVSAPNLQLQLSGAQRSVYNRVTDIVQLPQLSVVDVLDGVIHFPWQVAPGEAVTFQAAANSPVSAQGSWTIGGVMAQVVRAASGQAVQYQWQVPSTLTPGTPLSFIGTNVFGQTVVNVPNPAVIVASPPASAAQVGPSLSDCTPRGFAGRVVCLCGWFPTTAARDGFTLDGQALGVVAASSTTVLVRIPDNAQPGPRAIKGDPALGFASDESIPFVVLAARGSVDQNRLRRGQTTPLRLEVLGTTEQLDIVLTNHTPGIVNITGGIVQIVRSSGGTPNIAERQVQGITPGAFDIGYQTADDPCPCVTGPGTVVAGSPIPLPNPPPGLPPVPPAQGGGTTTGPTRSPPVPGDSTRTDPPLPPVPGGERTPPPVPPANPPVFPPSDDPREDDSCCGFRPDGTITFPKITDPLVPAQVGVAPRDPAVGASQVLLHNGAYFHNESDLEIDAVGLPFRFARHYKGDIQTVDGGLLGHRWDFSLNKRIVPQAVRELGNNLLLERPGLETPQLWYFDGQGRGVWYDGVDSEWRDVLNFGKRTPFRAYVTTYRQQPGDFYEIQRYIVEDPADHPFASHPNVQTEQGEAIFYVLRERNGVRYIFNCRGQLLHVLHRNDLASLAGAGVSQTSDSVRLSFEYDGELNPLTQNRMLSRVRDPSGHIYTLTTRSIGLASLETNIDCVPRSETIPIPRLAELSGGGRVISFDYRTGSDGSPILASVTDAVGAKRRVKEYTYDHADRLATAVSPKQAATQRIPYITNGYDALGRVVTQTLGDPNAPSPSTSRIVYGTGTTSVTDPVGNDVSYALTTVGGFPVVSSRTVFQRDSVHPASWTTSFEHNGHTQVTKITEPRGNEVLFHFDGQDDPVTAGWIRNKNAGVTYARDLSAGNMLAMTRVVGSAGPGPSATTNVSYEALFNQIEAQEDARAYRTEYTYAYQRPGDLGNAVAIQLPTITRPDGSQVTPGLTEYAYNEKGQQIRSHIGGRRTTTWQYNRAGYLFEERLPTAARRRTSRDPFGRVLGEFGDLGDVRYELTPFGETARRIGDPGGFANQTEFIYDLDGALVETIVELKDNFDPGSGRPPVEFRRYLTTRTDLDLLGRVVREVKKGSSGDSLVVEHMYNAKGLLAGSTHPGPGGARRIDQFRYDARGLATLVTIAAGTQQEMIVRTAYDANGNESQVEEVAARSPAGSPRVTRYEYDGLDRLVVQTDPLGSRIDFTLDVAGNVVGETVTGLGGVVLARKDTEFDAVSNVIRTTSHALDAAGQTATSEVFYNRFLEEERTVGAAGGVSIYSYDNAGRVIEVVTPGLDTTRTRYDRAGNRTELYLVEVGDAMDAAGNRNAVQSTTATRFKYDALGRVGREIGPSHNAEHFYDSFGNLRGTRLADGTADSIRYDHLSRKIQHHAGNVTRRFVYGPSGLPIEMYNNTARVVLKRDPHGNLIEESRTGSGITVIQRDGLGNPIRVTDANGTTTISTFNGVGQPLVQRITTATGAGGTPSVITPESIHWQYDGLGRVVVAEARHGPMGGDRVITRLAYDGLGRVTSEEQDMDGVQYSFQHSYRPNHLESSTTYPSDAGGTVVTRQADVLGRVKVILGDNRTIATYSYEGPGRMSGRQYTNGVVTQYLSDGQNRLQRIHVSATSGFATPKRLWSNSVLYGRYGLERIEQTWHRSAAGDWSESLTELSYDQNGASNGSSTTTTSYQDTLVVSRERTALYQALTGGVHRATGETRYDILRQQTRFVRADAFQYDSVGRKRRIDVSIGTRVSSPSQLLTSAGTIAAEAASAGDRLDGTKIFVYDKRGQLISDGELNYSYDHQGRLVWVEDVTPPGGLRGEAVYFTYDAFGRRVRSFPIHPNATTGFASWSNWAREPAHFLYDGDAVVAELASPGSGITPPRLRRRYVLGARPGERVQIEDWSGGATPEVFYPHEGVQSDVAFVTTNLAHPRKLVFTTPPSGVGFTIPDDMRQIEGTGARAPYLSWTTRVDGFAGIKTDELTGAPQLDYRSIRTLADSAATMQMRQAVETSMNNGALILGAASTAVLAGMVGGAALASGSTQLSWSGVASSVGIGSLTASVGGAAIAYFSGDESYGMQTFLRDAGTGAAFGLIVGRMIAAGWGATQSLAGEQVIQNAVITLTGVTQGRSIGEAWSAALISTAIGGSMGLGANRLFGKRASQGAKLSGRASSGRGAAAGAGGAQAPRASRSGGRNIEWGSFDNVANQTGFRAYAGGLAGIEDLIEETLEALERGTKLARTTARAIRSGRVKVRLGHFNNPMEHGFVFHKDPSYLYINTELLFGVHGLGPNHIASTIVHEAVHAFGGGEIAAHVAQAQFMRHTLRRVGPMQRARSGMRPSLWLDDGGIALLEAWEQGRKGMKYGKLTTLIDSWGYGRTGSRLAQFPSTRIDHRIRRAGGFAVLLDVDPAWAEMLARILDNGRIVGHWE